MNTQFSYTSKSEWIALIESTIKGKSFTDIRYSIEPGLSISPFQHREDVGDKITAPLKGDNRNLQIGVRIGYGGASDSNKRLHTALQNGCNALRIPYEFLQTPGELDAVLKDIPLPSTHIEFGSPTALPLSQRIDLAGAWLQQVYIESGLNPVSTGFHFTPSECTEVYQRIGRPQFHTGAPYYWANIEIDLAHPTEGISQGLHDLLALLALDNSAQNPFLQHLCITVHPSDDFLRNIAALRALKIALANVESALTFALPAPLLCAQIEQSPIQGDLRLEYIPLTYKVMSVLAGGVQRLFVSASQDTEEANRITCNIIHLLSLESHFNRVMDPAAGSYFIEGMTEKIATRAWAKLHQKQKGK